MEEEIINFKSEISNNKIIVLLCSFQRCVKTWHKLRCARSPFLSKMRCVADCVLGSLFAILQKHNIRNSKSCRIKLLLHHRTIRPKNTKSFQNLLKKWLSMTAWSVTRHVLFYSFELFLLKHVRLVSVLLIRSN